MSRSLTDFNHEELLAFQVIVEQRVVQLRQANIPTNLNYINPHDLASFADKTVEVQKTTLDDLSTISQALQPQELALLDAFIIYLLHGQNFKTSLPDIMTRNTARIDNPLGITEIVMPVLVLSNNTLKKP